MNSTPTPTGGARRLTAHPCCRSPRRADTDQHIAIDWTSCEGHGPCAELLSDITPDEWGYPLVDDDSAPPRTAKRARRAAAYCPALAFRLTAR
ncbi:ferredoxin [Streptomyces sp. V4I8]|uniref:ferredoxin n=1 Tax=Streptomyces sp. V4I8 TaxID=3156469 RepID=UPI003512C662